MSLFLNITGTVPEDYVLIYSLQPHLLATYVSLYLSILLNFKLNFKKNFPWGIVSDIAIFVLKRDVKLQLTNSMGIFSGPHSGAPAFYDLTASTQKRWARSSDRIHFPVDVGCTN